MRENLAHFQLQSIKSPSFFFFTVFFSFVFIKIQFFFFSYFLFLNFVTIISLILPQDFMFAFFVFFVCFYYFLLIFSIEVCLWWHILNVLENKEEKALSTMQYKALGGHMLIIFHLKNRFHLIVWTTPAMKDILYR